VIVVLYGGPANLALVRFLTEESRAGRSLGLNELLVLDALLRERSITTRRASQLTQLPETDARQLLIAMVEAGVLESRGEARGRSYHLSAAVYRALGEEAAYVRSRGFEPFQQEQMILQFVEAHGRITRSQAAELCKVTPERARRILRGLVERGQLRVVGQRRAAHYVLNPKE
jgi:ATP-dependent DNA helicase RecG